MLQKEAKSIFDYRFYKSQKHIISSNRNNSLEFSHNVLLLIILFIIISFNTLIIKVNAQAYLVEIVVTVNPKPPLMTRLQNLKL